jgi:hypothetical protein
VGAGPRGCEFLVFGAFENELTEDARGERFAGPAPASLRLESQMGNDRLARQINRQPLRTVLG